MDSIIYGCMLAVVTNSVRQLHRPVQCPLFSGQYWQPPQAL